MNESSEIQDISALFNNTKMVPQRDVDAARRGRTAFLQQALSMELPVSVPPKRRHIEWFNNFFQKERVTMFATILVIISLLLGGTSATVYASQTSMPDQPLYAVKMWTEQVRSTFSTSPDHRYELMLRFADQRVDEMERMTRAGKTPPEGLIERLRLHLDECLRLADQKEDAEMLRTLERLRTRLQLQDQHLAQAQEQAGPAANAVLTRARTMLQTRLQLMETAQQDPQRFRNQLRLGIPESIDEPLQNREMHREQFQNREGIESEEIPAPGKEYGAGYGPVNERNAWGDEIPAPRYRYGAWYGEDDNPWSSGSPNQGGGYGSGTEKGGNPWTDTTPTPGSGYGPGPGSGGNPSGCTSPDGCQKSGGSDSGGNGSKK